MRREENILNGELTPLQYIESVGNAWINTGFTPNQDTRVVCEFMIAQLPPEWANGARDENVISVPFGSRYDFMTQSFTTYLPANSASARIISYGSNGQFVATQDSNQVNVRFKIDADKNVWKTYKNDSLVSTKNFSKYNFTCPYPMLLFNTLSYSTLSGEHDTILGPSTGQIRMYLCDIYDNGTQVRQYRPYLNGGGAGMLDEINNVWYGNQGTGYFLYN